MFTLLSLFPLPSFSWMISSKLIFSILFFFSVKFLVMLVCRFAVTTEVLQLDPLSTWRAPDSERQSSPCRGRSPTPGCCPWGSPGPLPAARSPAVIGGARVPSSERPQSPAQAPGWGPCPGGPSRPSASPPAATLSPRQLSACPLPSTRMRKRPARACLVSRPLVIENKTFKILL